jgi:hypothetical protein
MGAMYTIGPLAQS